MGESEVIFEVTVDHLESGLRGIPVGYCTTSSVDPQKGLYYVERPVSELAEWNPEQVIFLLYNGHEGSADEVAAFSDELARRGRCDKEVVERIRLLPRTGHPMSMFTAALLIAGMVEGTGDYREDCLNLIAKVPEIAATVINHHAGWGEAPASDPELGYMENFVHLLRTPDLNKEMFGRVMRVFDVLHFDHGGGNLSTFVGKAVASGLEDMYGSIAAAMCALAGPRHGRANQDCLVQVKEIMDKLGPDVTDEQMEQYVRDRLANKELIYGFGHAVLRVEDPRASIFYSMAQELYPDFPLVKVALKLRKNGTKVLKENPKVANPYPNVDAMSGTLLTAAGFPYPEYYTVFFGMSRCVGIARQILYERVEARGGKGTPIVRPKYLYKSSAQGASV